MSRGIVDVRPRTRRGKRKHAGPRGPGGQAKSKARRGRRSGWPRVAHALKKCSWAATFATIGMALLIGFPFFAMIDEAIPRHVHRRGDLWVCNLKTRSNVELDQVNGRTEDIPKEFRDLDGKRVEMIGQMWAPYRADGKVQDFDLVYSIANCCFAGPPRVQHIVKAKAREGELFPYSAGRVKVSGTLHVGVVRDSDAIESIYRLDVDHVTAD